MVYLDEGLKKIFIDQAARRMKTGKIVSSILMNRDRTETMHRGAQLAATSADTTASPARTSQSQRARRQSRNEMGAVSGAIRDFDKIKEVGRES
jgi:hypothetical protein